MILDATFLIDLARRDARAKQAAARLVHEPTMIPTVVVAQVLAGSNQPDTVLRTLEAAGQIVPFGPSEALEAGRLARERIAEGRFPGWDDILIAATAKVHRMPVLTRNTRHFDGVETVTY